MNYFDQIEGWEASSNTIAGDGGNTDAVMENPGDN